MENWAQAEGIAGLWRPPELVPEDEPLIGLDIVAGLEGAGVKVDGTVG